MSNEIDVRKVQSLVPTLALWESDTDLKQIKEIYGKNLSVGEFNTLVQMGRATGLNPFLKEIWAVKYGDTPAQIFIGRDGYRKSAQRHPLYDYHVADAVYSADKFDVVNGEVVHKYSLANRGNLVGAYCVVQRKGSSRPTYVFVELKEYSTNKSLWNPQTGKPATMIKKVAEAQGLKSAFQELFAGTYSEYEQYDEGSTDVAHHTRPGKGVSGLKAKLNEKAKKAEPVEEHDEPIDFDGETGEVIEAEVIDEPAPQEEPHTDVDTVKFLLESATTKKELIRAMQDMKLLSAPERKEVLALYKKRDAELNG